MWVKICGIKDVKTATEVANCHVDAIGLNFYSPSPRSVTLQDAHPIVNALPADVIPVGLFVNHSLEDVISHCQQLHLTTVQLHGDETPEYLSQLQQQLPQLNIIRAYRMGQEGLAPLIDYIDSCNKLNVSLFACLIDAHVEGTYGGTGKTVAWDKLKKEKLPPNMPPLILAGGLNTTNIAEAIVAVKPWGVDIASGVESSPGVKDISQVLQLMNEVKHATT